MEFKNYYCRCLLVVMSENQVFVPQVPKETPCHDELLVVHAQGWGLCDTLCLWEYWFFFFCTRLNIVIFLLMLLWKCSCEYSLIIMYAFLFWNVSGVWMVLKLFVFLGNGAQFVCFFLLVIFSGGLWLQESHCGHYHHCHWREFRSQRSR